MSFKQAVKNSAALPLVGNSDKDLRVVLDTGDIYQRSTAQNQWIDRHTTLSSYNCYPITTDDLISLGATNKYVTEEQINGWNDHVSNSSNPHGVTKAQVGLGNVDNTADLDKPISAAVQTALNTKATLASPAFTGIPTAPTASLGTSTEQIASTAFVQSAIDAMWQVGTVTTNASGLATFNFPTPFPPGVVPIVMAIALASNPINLYNVQLNAVPTNTSCQVKVNLIGGTSISLLGLLSLTIFTAAPSGVTVYIAARAP